MKLTDAPMLPQIPAGSLPAGAAGQPNKPSKPGEGSKGTLGGPLCDKGAGRIGQDEWKPTVGHGPAKDAAKKLIDGANKPEEGKHGGTKDLDKDGGEKKTLTEKFQKFLDDMKKLADEPSSAFN